MAEHKQSPVEAYGRHTLFGVMKELVEAGRMEQEHIPLALKAVPPASMNEITDIANAVRESRLFPESHGLRLASRLNAYLLYRLSPDFDPEAKGRELIAAVARQAKQAKSAREMEAKMKRSLRI